MPDRKYETRLRGTVTVSDSGEVQVDVDLIDLPFQMRNDVLASHPDPEITRDINTVKALFMESPLNHRITSTLHS